MPLLVLALPVAMSFASGGAASSGQLRYAYLQSGSLMESLRAFVPDWSLRGVIISLFWLPFPPLWILVSCAAAWQYAVFKYHEVVGEVDQRAAELCYRARTALTLSRKHAAAILALEQEALTVARVAARDARLSRAVKATDFFDQASQAWDCVQKTSHPYEALTQRAKEAHRHAVELGDVAEGGGSDEDDSDSDGDKEELDNSFAEMLVESAKGALAAAEDVERKLEIAKASIHQCRAAVAQAKAARDAEANHANRARSALQELVAATKGASLGLAAAVDSFERVQWLANQAKAQAVCGEMARASALLSSAETEVARVASQAASLGRMESSAREVVLGCI